jgi:hypothetical protein
MVTAGMRVGMGCFVLAHGVYLLLRYSCSKVAVW